MQKKFSRRFIEGICLVSIFSTSLHLNADSNVESPQEYQFCCERDSCCSTGISQIVFWPVLISTGILCAVVGGYIGSNNRGKHGKTGDTGAKGDHGTPGQTGADGPAGSTGPIGPTGNTGTAGATGSQGPEGPQGLQGVAGTPGAAGAAGPQGAAGAAGAAGAPGAAGAQGGQGAAGVAGPAGATGPAGAGLIATGTQAFTFSEITNLAGSGSISIFVMTPDGTLFSGVPTNITDSTTATVSCTSDNFFGTYQIVGVTQTQITGFTNYTEPYFTVTNNSSTIACPIALTQNTNQPALPSGTILTWTFDLHQ